MTKRLEAVDPGTGTRARERDFLVPQFSGTRGSEDGLAFGRTEATSSMDDEPPLGLEGGAREIPPVPEFGSSWESASRWFSLPAS